MATSRAHFVLPTHVIEEIDAMVGDRGRSAFVAETLENELRRRRLRKFLAEYEPLGDEAWNPELVRLGTAKWVRKIRKDWGRPAAAVNSRNKKP